MTLRSSTPTERANGQHAKLAPEPVANRTARAIPASFHALVTTVNLIGRFAPGLSARFLQSLWFRPFHARPGTRTQAFWRSAHRRTQMHSGQATIDLHFWGDPGAPLLLGVHGWRGSGVQFRHFVEPLTAAGYQVCLFDMPAHGMNPTRFTHVYEFMQVLLTIQEEVGRPAGVIAHSIGCQAVVQALARGFQPGYLGFISPGLNMEAMVDRFGQTLGLSENVHRSLKARLAKKSIGISKAWIGTRDTLFQTLSHDVARQHLTLPGLLIADDQDEEIDWQDIKTATDYWPLAGQRFSSGLGHYRILKDEAVIADLTAYFKALL
ncbi:alpha/beta fold hydrolase [Saccharospirillum impatiens]|uniref:alpha/beta fold hydrolase n=1 Tax=Saccharospirillum impatiens TaxID=169438 RepID=UPI000403D799|nr:alpha/beta fold hydrolase [Saccharospirillum impatiens]